MPNTHPKTHGAKWSGPARKILVLDDEVLILRAVTRGLRAAGLEVLKVVDRAIERGFLAPAPTEDACGRCDFRPVCGPGMAARVLRKPQNELADLHAMRSRP